MLRLFVGLKLPDDVRARLTGLMGGVSGARWQADEQLHLTLRFIGEVSEDRAEDIDSALSVTTFQPFQINLNGVGIFGTMVKPRMVWAGVAPADPVVKLAQKIESALVRTGLPPETRKYVPHITLARLRGPALRLERFLSGNDHLTSEPWLVRSFTLFQSHLAHTGAIYRSLASYPDDPDGDDDH